MVISEESIPPSKRGFTLTEVMGSVAISTLVLGTMLTTYLTHLGTADYASIWFSADHSAYVAIDRIVKGTGGNAGLREFNLETLEISTKDSGWHIEDIESSSAYTYSSIAGTICDAEGSVLVSNVENAELGVYEATIYLSVTIKKSRGNSETSRHYETSIQPRN